MTTILHKFYFVEVSTKKGEGIKNPKISLRGLWMLPKENYTDPSQ